MIEEATQLEADPDEDEDEVDAAAWCGSIRSKAKYRLQD